MADIICQACGKPITSFDQWYREDCFQETPDKNLGHALTWEQIMALEWRPVAQQEQQEATP